jgi:hypothetical protein
MSENKSGGNGSEPLDQRFYFNFKNVEAIRH